MRRYIGIDPGSKGSFAMIPAEGEIEIYPLEHDVLISKCREWQNDECVCCLEKVGVMPGQGIVSSGNFMKGVGYVQGVLESLNIPYQEILPSTWKKEFGCNLGKSVSYKDKKQADVDACRKLYPQITLRRTGRSKTDWSDAADALLMATYAKRKF